MGDVDRLWAPWRGTFLAQRGRRACIFCAAKRSRLDERALVVARGREVFAILNRYPYTNGHVMVAPYRHVGDLQALSADAWAEMLEVTQRLMACLREIIRAQGFNIGLNVGQVAGAGIPGHLHLHVVPRWRGDVNYMSVIGETRVISQSLEEVYRRITPWMRNTTSTRPRHRSGA